MVEEKDSQTIKSEDLYSLLQQDQLEEYLMTEVNIKDDNKQVQNTDQETNKKKKKKNTIPDEYFQSMKQMQQIADYNATFDSSREQQ
jgi:hypothetical protein